MVNVTDVHLAHRRGSHSLTLVIAPCSLLRPCGEKLTSPLGGLWFFTLVESQDRGATGGRVKGHMYLQFKSILPDSFPQKL